MCFKKGLLNSPVCYAMIEQIEPQIRTFVSFAMIMLINVLGL